MHVDKISLNYLFSRFQYIYILQKSDRLDLQKDNKIKMT